MLFLLLLSVNCLFALNCFAQQKTVSQILLSGNLKTKDYVIRRELTTLVDSVFSQKKLDTDRDRLSNLHIFSSIDIDTLDRGDSVTVVIYVQERMRFAPFPLMGYTEMFGWAYGGGFYYRNLAGRNRALRCYALFGGTAQFSATYYDPWITGERISLIAETEHTVRDHPYENFRQTDQNLWLELGKTWNYTYSGRIKAGFRKVESDIIDITLTGDYYDYLPFIRFTGVYDSRDVWINPSRGWAMGVKIGQDGIPGSRPDFYEFSLSCARFFPLPLGRTFGILAAFGTRNGSLPVYERFYFGGMSSVRGLPPNFDRGRRYILTGTEYRFDLVEPTLIWQNFDVGCGGALFLDCGAVTDTSPELLQTKYYTGFGFGLRIFVPFIEVARFDCGWTADSSLRLGAEMGMKF